MKGFTIMTRRSKLEMYVDILKALARHGPLKLTHIMYKANVNCSVLTLLKNKLCTRKETKQKLFTPSRKEVELYSNTSGN